MGLAPSEEGEIEKCLILSSISFAFSLSPFSVSLSPYVTLSLPTSLSPSLSPLFSLSLSVSLSPSLCLCLSLPFSLPFSLSVSLSLPLSLRPSLTVSLFLCLSPSLCLSLSFSLSLSHSLPFPTCSTRKGHVRRLFPCQEDSDLLAPWSRTFGLQNAETVSVCCVSHHLPVVFAVAAEPPGGLLPSPPVVPSVLLRSWLAASCPASRAPPCPCTSGTLPRGRVPGRASLPRRVGGRACTHPATWADFGVYSCISPGAQGILMSAEWAPLSVETGLPSPAEPAALWSSAGPHST